MSPPTLAPKMEAWESPVEGLEEKRSKIIPRGT